MAGLQSYVAVGGKVRSTAFGDTYDQVGVLRLAAIYIRAVLEGEALTVDSDLERLEQLLRAARAARQQANGVA